MMIRKRSIKNFVIRFIFCAGWLLLLPAAGHSERVIPPGGIFYYQPASTVYGSEAVWINPAALVGSQLSEYQFMAEYASDKIDKSWGTSLIRSGLGVAYRKVYNPSGDDFKESIWAAALPLGKEFGFGASYRHFFDGPEPYDNRHFWNIGFMDRGSGPFSWAALFSNLNRGKINGEKTETEMQYSVGYRPFKKVLTLAVDMFLSTGMKMSEADFIYHAEYTPKPGLYLNGFVTSDKEFQIGIRANFAQYYSGIKSLFTKSGDHSRSTLFLGANSLKQPSLIKPKTRRLSISMGRSVPENPVRPVFGRSAISFTEFITNIYRAADDNSISEIVLNMQSNFSGLAQAQEIRAALEYFKAKEKLVTVHLQGGSNLSYFVATVADKIFLAPVSRLNLVGLRAELTFYTGTIEKLGAKADFVRVGDYKSAIEPWTRKESSEANKEQVNRLLDDTFDQFVSTLAKGRSISSERMKELIDSGPFTSAEAVEAGLVDGLSYRDEMSKDNLSHMPQISFRRYLTDTLTNDGWPSLPKIAVVVAEGEIQSQPGGPLSSGNKLTPGSLKGSLALAAHRRDIKGIVLRLNSPGGEALAAEEIYHYSTKMSKRKPTVISMGNVAASGGYHLAAAGQKLFASEGTITGSIGIYGGKIELSELYHKIELGKELYTRGRFAGMLSTARPFTEEERTKYLSQLEAFYEYFTSLVAENRSLTQDSVKALAGGQVWTGREAFENGLVDRLGGIQQSLDFAAEAAGIEDYRVEILPKRTRWFSIPGLSLLNGITKIFSGNDNPESLLSEMSDLSAEGNIMARMPYDIVIE